MSDEPVAINDGGQGLRLDRGDAYGEKEEGDFWTAGMHEPGGKDSKFNWVHAKWHAWVTLAHAIIQRDMEMRIESRGIESSD